MTTGARHDSRLRVLVLALAGPACLGSLSDEEKARFFDVGVFDLGGPACPDVVAEILSNTAAGGCASAGCHPAGGALDLESPGVFDRLAGTPSPTCSGELWVDPDRPDESFLYTKLLASPPCGNRMPLGGNPLSSEQIGCVLSAITAAVRPDAPDAGAGDATTGDAATGDAGDAGSGPCPDVVATRISRTTPGGCAVGGCHAAGSSLDLASPGVLSRLAGVESQSCPGEVYVSRERPAESLLYTKLLPGPLCGTRMPLGAEPLPASEIACVLEAIEALGEEPGTEADFEAEAMSLQAPIVIAQDPGASGGSYIVLDSETSFEAPDASRTGSATYRFRLGQAGQARIFARVRSFADDSDSAWVRIGDGAFVRWNDVGGSQRDAWIWEQVWNSDAANAPLVVELSAGEHRLEVVGRERNFQMDRFIVTVDPNFTPPAN